MITVTDLVESLGPGLLQVVVEGRDAEVHDVVLAEPGDAAGQRGALVLGVVLAGPDAAVALLEQASAAGAGGVVVKAPTARDPRVRRAARRLGAALVELRPHASWAHVVWLLRGAVDRASAPDTGALGTPGVHNDLFALADTAAEIVDAPVTIEDTRSRVLAHSARQDTADPARLSTIVGRRVPPQVLAHYRAAGVFRRLARSDEPVLVPAGPDGTLPRLVVPVRAGGEWLGSVWAVAGRPVPAERVRELTGIASVLALHLLRLRAEAGIARRVSAGRLRAALRGGAPDSDGGPGLPGGPWRVALLGAPGGPGDVRPRLDVWESVVRRFGWHQPLLADLDGLLFALVTEAPRGGAGGGVRDGVRDGAAPGCGSAAWLRHVLARVRPHDPGLYATVGGPAHSPEELPRSRAEAVELDRLVASGRLTVDAGTGTGTETDASGAVFLEDVWDAVVVERARAAVLRSGSALLGGPLAALEAHDRAHGTCHLVTLAAWLDHFGDPRSAARELRVHPNTLRYRLRRLGEAADLDLSSPRTRLALRLQLAALEDGGATGGE
ncbi:PucR family transcriptional regulator [Streptomyces sp. NPDC059637]|uniref:PucR family transcriptional regulator n=1 Tax=Streptomyces sp. NPDC059637 TaxID=3347752 RepID=UPI00368C0673